METRRRQRRDPFREGMRCTYCGRQAHGPHGAPLLPDTTVPAGIASALDVLLSGMAAAAPRTDGDAR